MNLSEWEKTVKDKGVELARTCEVDNVPKALHKF
jgi:hypothetical protein